MSKPILLNWVLSCGVGYIKVVSSHIKLEMHRTVLHPHYIPLNRDFILNTAPMMLSTEPVKPSVMDQAKALLGKRQAPSPRVLVWMERIQHVLLEMMASVLVIYSSVLIPESESDYLKQYVGSITVFAILMTLKDALYFFPDCTPMTTIVLWSASVYTNEDRRTDWLDILSRLFGQMLGYGVVFLLANANKDVILEQSLITNVHNRTLYAGLDSVHAINEGLGTMIECVCVAFATMPLMGTYSTAYGDGGDSSTKSKLEATAPSGMKVFYYALSVSVIHYAIEQLFKTTMNPFITILQCVLRGDSNFGLTVSLQFFGLSVACVYVYLFQPTQRTLKYVHDN